MAYNLLISYDLNKPDQNYSAVIKCIQSLGSWAKIHKSVWYVKSSLTAEQASAAVWKVMDSSDTVFVVNASANNAAWNNITPEASEFVRAKWNS